MSIIFTLCTLNSTLVNYYYNVKSTTYMVYFSIIIVVYFSIIIYKHGLVGNKDTGKTPYLYGTIGRCTAASASPDS